MADAEQSDEMRPEPKPLQRPVAAPMKVPHALVEGLIVVLPPAGARFTRKKRETWLQAAAGILDMIYAD